MPSSPLCLCLPEGLPQEGMRQARGSLTEARERAMPVLSHAERVDMRSWGGMASRLWHPRPQPFQHVLLLSYIVISFKRALASRLEVTTMLLETIFAPFVKERPICVMAGRSWSGC